MRLRAVVIVVVVAFSSRLQAATPHQREAHHQRREVHHQEEAPALGRSITELREDIAALRRELADVKAEAHGTNWDDAAAVPFMEASLTKEEDEPRTLPPPLPAIPAADQPAVIEVEDARAYLLRTAVPGATMVRQHPEVAIDRLHPDFAVRLAEAIKRARSHGLTDAGVFSAYRPPAFGVGGFSDKFNSLHSYGLAADVANIGRPGSKQVRIWKASIKYAGLYLPYGINNKSEFNHVQLISDKVASKKLRPTITASAPRNLNQMWLAAAVRSHIIASGVTATMQADK
jgi:hypothetical protein